MQGNLKLLLDPVYTAKEIDKCSTFWQLSQIAKHWLEQGPNRFVYLTTGLDGTYDTPSITDPRWIRVPIHRNSDRYREMWFPHISHQQALNGWSGPFGDWDVVLTTRSNGFYWFRLMGQQGLHATRLATLMEPYPFLSFKKTFPSGARHTERYVIDNLQTISSYMAFNHIYINTEYERAETLEISRTLLAATETRRLANKMVATYPQSPLDLDYPFSEEAEQRFKKRGHMWIIYPQRMDETERRFSKIHKTFSLMYSMLAASGMKIRMQICSNSAVDLPGPLANDSSFLTIERPPRDKFWQRLKECQIFFSFAIEEGLPFALLEAIQLGTIGIVSRYKWSEDLFGKDYPFLVNDVHEAFALVKKIYSQRKWAWETYLNWYQNYFTKVIIPRGDNQVRLERDIQTWSSNLDELVKNKALDDPVEVAESIDKHIKSGYVDMLHLPKGAKVRQIRNLREQDFEARTPYYLLPKRWIISYYLRSVHGWEATEKPWILRKVGKGGK